MYLNKYILDSLQKVAGVLRLRITKSYNPIIRIYTKKWINCVGERLTQFYRKVVSSRFYRTATLICLFGANIA
jgi:hypothetical protein